MLRYLIPSRSRKVATIAIFSLAFMVIPTATVAAPATERVIVVLDAGRELPEQAAEAAAAATGGTLTHVYNHSIRGFAIEVPQNAVGALARRPGVAWVEPDVEVSIAQTGSQPLPTHLDRTEWDLNQPLLAMTGVNIAIIDTGVDLYHPDLNVVQATNCTGAIFYPLFGGCTTTGLGDENGHGTHVAGLAAGCDNDIGTIGTAPCAQITSVKVLNADGSGALSGILAGLDLVAANASWIHVANASWGFEGTSDALRDSVNGVIASGVVFVAAAGNNAQDVSTFMPAAVPDAFTISALADFDGKPGGLGSPTCRADVDDTLADFSNFGSGIDMAAPGVCLMSTWLNGGYAVASGTSMASPVAAGAVARYIAENGRATNRQSVLAIQAAIVNGAFDASGVCGFGDGSGEALLSLSGSAYSSGGSCESGPVVNQPPTAAFTYECVDLACTFDGSGSTDDGGSATLTHSWAFGDNNTASGPTPTHTFAAAGQYSVTLTVQDAESLSDTATEIVTVSVAPPNAPPTAQFTADCPDLRCTFDASASYDDGFVDGYLWTFGDGTTSTEGAPSHSYAISGSYTVTLVVTDNDGASSQPESKALDIVNAAPVATFTVDCVGLSCSVDASGSTDDGGIVGYSWAFGDGSTASGVTATHDYSGAGAYQISLTVADAESASHTASQAVTVDVAPPLTMTTVNIGYLWEAPVATQQLAITDENLDSVNGAEVTGYWSYLNKGGKVNTTQVTFVSNENGIAEQVTTFKKNQSPFEFCIVDIVADGYVYVPFGNPCSGPFGGVANSVWSRIE